MLMVCFPPRTVGMLTQLGVQEWLRRLATELLVAASTNSTS